MNKHTPGPWRVIEHSWSDSGIYADAKRIAGLTIYDEANESNQRELESEMDANARLIAAAPDLLEALENLANVAERNTDDVNEWEAVIAAARAAIAKAKGETV